VKRTVISLSVGTALGLTAAAIVAFAGPLDPPADPVTPTFKTLNEVEPRTPSSQANTPGGASATFIISKPGSYYLTGNLLGQAGRTGISIAASNVTIDLNGFTVDGQGVGGGQGITATASFTDITIRNGTVANWTSNGVNLLGGNSVVERITASGNSGAGISAGPDSVVRDWVAHSNVAAGIAIGDDSTATGCQARTNATGISAAISGVVTDCLAASNTLTGIVAGNSGRITRCTATANEGDGIRASSGALVSACSAQGNTGDGIEVFGDALVTGNMCDGNGAAGDGAGIHATSTDNRIQANACNDADRGIDVDLAGNIIIGNTCAGNATNFAIAGNNYFCAIVDRAGILVSAVTGSTAGSSLATSDPHANFAY